MTPIHLERREPAPDRIGKRRPDDLAKMAFELFARNGLNLDKPKGKLMKKTNKIKIIAGIMAAVFGLAAHADPRGSSRDRDDDDDRSNNAAEICFTAFEGTVYYQFSITGRLPSDAVAFPLQGRVFGALVPCAGLGQWPITGTVVVDGDQIVLAFRAMTVDAASCGAVDYIVHLDPVTLAGPLQLHNGRKDFSNESTLTPAACARPPAPGELGRRGRAGGADSQGNPAP